MNDNPEQPQSAESSELPGDGQPASRPRRRSRRPAVRGEAAGVQSSGVESGVSAAREPRIQARRPGLIFRPATGVNAKAVGQVQTTLRRRILRG